MGFKPLPTNENVLLIYTAWRFLYSKVIAKTVSAEITGILSHHIDLVIYIKRDEFLRLKRAIAGFRKLRGSTGNEK